MGVEIIKDAIPYQLCLAAEAAWPDQFWPHWHWYNGATANKYGSMDRNRIPAACLAALDALALAVIPSIGDSFIDYDLHAAGLHMMPPGGFLARHLDAERHPIHPWRRTCSIVMSVNSNWDAKRFGGELQLEHGSDLQLISPEIGTAVIFTTKNQWHEVLPVSACKSTCCNEWRNTLALFAWDNEPEYDGRTAASFQEKTNAQSSL